jgi:catalase
MMSKEQQKVLFENTARNMGDAPMLVKIRHIKNCMQADEAYGKGVAKELKIELSEIK